ncbi:MAG: 6-bladed beta-propeller [Bacteroidota bacterium]
MEKPQNDRRQFFKQSSLLVGAGLTAPVSTFEILHKRRPNGPIVGHGDYRYHVDKEWGVQDSLKIPVKDCHEMVEDRKGRLILLTNHVKNNVIIYDKSGRVLDVWGQQFPGAHGLTISEEGGEEFLYITDQDLHQVFKTTLDGRILMTLDYPKESGVYEKADQYKPTETAIAPNGDIYVADGYGLNYITQYNAKGEYIRHFGGKGKGDDQFDCCHGVCVDQRDPANPVLLITSRTKQEFKRFTLDGQYLRTTSLPGCWICRPVLRGDQLYFAVIVTESWGSYDGFVAVLDKNDRMVSAPGASAPTYDANGQMNKVTYDGMTFLNPHDVCVDRDENLYVPQWYSGKTYPIRLERV